ncbi:hypothetical protein PIB30_046258 [Stylosanthes scabra]|uniref:Uncharacterized protein n=1 Tax=Stylosanthes scabra TaxID=79078 RepID=A0ABU6WGF6_9FABA|nr:hypothetical protein [Stylosanthes scabra]
MGSQVKRHAYEMFNIQRQAKKKILCSVFNTEMRVLHYILNYILMPRAHAHGHVIDDDIITIWAIVNEIKINWTYFIVQHMLRFTKGTSTTGFDYVCLWSRIFHHFCIDLSEKLGKTMGSSSVIDIRTFHHMGRAMEEQEQEEQVQPPPQDQAGPSMQDMMQVLQRIEQNQARMDQHFQNVDRRLYRIEQYLEIEEDEDEEQD